MKILQPVAPTAEQLQILTHNRPGTVLVRGAAGSGKTTTAMLRLRQLCEFWMARRARLGSPEDVRVLVLTYNRTLEGYIRELATSQVAPRPGLDLTISTFGRWAYNLIPGDGRTLLDPTDTRKVLRRFAAAASHKTPTTDLDFLIEEAQYVMDRFDPTVLDTYLGVRRTGRGTSPRMEAEARRTLLEDIIRPYLEYMHDNKLMDWNDVALAAANVTTTRKYDVIVVDEAQDFSANQARATHAQLADPGSLTFVLDAVQRIYPRSFTWREAGIDLDKTFTLARNYRNTRQIAAFARAIVEGLPVEDDGTLPDFSACKQTGPKPVVLYGKYSDQIDAMLARLSVTADLGTESVAFLQPRGGAWFNYLRQRLTRAGIPFADLTRNPVWPAGPEVVALSTLHSAKGLEFDHVLIPGLNAEVTPHGPGDDDAQLDMLRRLVAMGAGRARQSLMLGAKPSDASAVLAFADRTTYDLETL